MSIIGISSSTLQSFLDSSLTPTSTSSANQTTTSSTSASSTSLDASTSSGASDTLTQDVVTLLKALATGDVSGAKADLAKLKTDLSSQNASSSSSAVTKDLTALLKDLTSGTAASAKEDLAKLKTDLKAQEASTASGTSSTSPLDTLVSKLSESLNSGSIESALTDVASYLVQNGQGTGTLVNTTA